MMKILKSLLLFCVLGSFLLAGTGNTTSQANPPSPSFKDVLSLESPSNVSISPDGKYILYRVSETDWDKNTYRPQIWMAAVKTGETRQMTFAPVPSTSYQWCPDSRSFAFQSSREKGKNQLYLMSVNGGEGKLLAEFETGIHSYAWSPDGKWIAYTAPGKKSKKQEGIEKKYGSFDVIDEDLGHDHLWLLEVATGKTEVVVDNESLHVGSIRWSPDGKKIAFVVQPDNRTMSFSKSDIYLVDVSARGVTEKITKTASSSEEKESKTGKKEKTKKYKITPLVVRVGGDGSPEWSPDGKTIAFSSQDGTESYFTNWEICTIPAIGGEITCLTKAFDEDTNLISWNREGLFFSAFQRMSRHIFRLNPKTKGIQQITSKTPKHFVLRGISFCKQGNGMAFSYLSESDYPELYYSPVRKFKPVKLTSFSSQVKDWKLASKEAISWKSTDGAEITGVLFKPADFDPAKKYPLFVVIHGGPASISYPQKYDRYNSYYPLEQWAAKGALILEPNYRGSAGFGEDFRKLNYRNLGVGDYWDVISGVDYLVEKGWVDKNKVAAAGWSQGGYISAYITTFSDRFKAVSVGAGVSDWVSYYYCTDITPFCVHYLGATPWTDPEIYKKTSPITHITKAKTPTLIQHGENDPRVPINNAYKLYRGLKDTGVPCKFVVYKGFGHGITKPKEKLAVLEHNWDWFNQYIFGEKPQ